MSESVEISPGALQLAYGVVSAFRKACNKKGGYTTAAWEKNKMHALKEWAGRKADSRGTFFEWRLVDRTHNILVFKEMNADSAATKAAVQLTAFYRGKRLPKSSISAPFRKSVNVVWFGIRGLSLSDQYLSHIEYNIACQVVYDLLVKKSREPVVVTPPPDKPGRRDIASDRCRSDTPVVGTTSMAHAHDALEEIENRRMDAQQEVVNSSAQLATPASPVQLKLLL